MLAMPPVETVVIACTAASKLCHPGEDVAEEAEDRERQVDRGQAQRDLAGARQDLAQRVEGLGAEQLHAADLERRQEDHRDDDDAEAAEPLQHAAPEQHPGRQAVEADEDRRAGGGDRRHRLEHRVGEARPRGAEAEGQRAEQREDRPRCRWSAGSPAAGPSGVRSRREQASAISTPTSPVRIAVVAKTWALPSPVRGRPPSAAPSTRRARSPASRSGSRRGGRRSCGQFRRTPRRCQAGGLTFRQPSLTVSDG